MNAAEQVLKEGYWGFQKVSWGGEASANVFRTPLPPTEQCPRVSRPCGNIDGVRTLLMPPYVCADLDQNGNVDVMICGGDGWRASHDSEQKDPRQRDPEQWIYADGDDLPEEWKAPLAEALEKIRAFWSGKTLVFRHDDVLSHEQLMTLPSEN